MSSTTISLWSCAAQCRDKTEREVVGLYKGNQSLLISRPWCAPASVPVLQIVNHRLYPLLATLMSAADYRAHQGTWYGEVAVNWKTITALTGLSQTTVYLGLRSLAEGGFVHYDPAGGHGATTLVRLFPYNAKSGVRLFQIEPSWLRDFMVSVAPKLALYEVTVSGKAAEFKAAIPNRSMAAMGAKISAAPVYVSSNIYHDIQGRVKEDKEVDVFLEELRNVAGLDEVYRTASGIDPLIGDEESISTMIFRDDVKKEPVDWRASGFSQRGIEVVVVGDEQAPPQPGEHGVAPSWDVVGDATAESVSSDRPQVPWSSNKEGSEAAREVADAASVVTRPWNPGSYGLRPLYLIGSSGPNLSEGPSTMKSMVELPGAVASGSAAAPPPAAPPAANAMFAAPESERQLHQGQVAALYQLRGERVGNAHRRRLTTNELSCIETYERLAGIPFCAGDMAYLAKCLTLTSHFQVLRAIRDCSRFPPKTPGAFLVRDGMSHVWNTIESSPRRQSRAKGDKRARAKAPRPGEARTDAINQSIRERKRSSHASSAAVSKSAPVVSPAAPVVPQANGIVSNNSAPVPTETKEAA